MTQPPSHWVEVNESSPPYLPQGPHPDTPPPSGILMVVVGYLVALLGPCRKACIMGSQAMLSLGSILQCIFLQQKKRVS